MPQTRARTRTSTGVEKTLTRNQVENVRARQKAAENCHVKRAADVSPDGKPTKKRTALGDMTNAKLSRPSEVIVKKLAVVKAAVKPEVKNDVIVEQDESSEQFFDATEEIPSSSTYATPNDVSCEDSLEASLNESSQKIDVPVSNVPAGVTDFDRENWLDPYSASPYAMDIFNYLKEREKKFRIGDYMLDQVELSVAMRTVLVDWFVEVQESFELNHETLYMSVKLTDLYLQKVSNVSKEMLQLVGVTAIFISSKFEERHPPIIEDFMYICDDAYTREQMIDMEESILKTVGFDIGFSLSYSFLRRYARCYKANMDLLTLSRYILETTLLCYDFVQVSESLIASAAFLLALKMKKLGGWSPTLEYYSGYKEEQLRDLVEQINNYLTKPISKGIKTIFRKYSHKIFYEVASTPLLENIVW